MRKKTFWAITLALGLMLSAPAPSAWAQIGANQTPLPGSSIPQWVNQLPTLTGAGGATFPNMEKVLLPTSQTTLYMKEFLVKMLPDTTPFAAGTTYNGTSVFGYRTDNAITTADTYIGPVFVTKRSQFTGVPATTVDNATEVRYVNNLGIAGNGAGSTTNVGVWKYSFDQTLHWADPNGQMGSLAPYDGPIPAVPHLHGGEVPAAVDGGPDAWFLSQAMTGYTMHGDGYYSKDGVSDKNYCIYRYPNTQESGPLWFHDHLLGGTRVNVYAGLAGAYLLTDFNLTLPTGMNAVGLNNGTLDLSVSPYNIPNGANTELTIPLVLQDRMFDTTGELYFPDVGLNPTVHPFWIPEFVGDTVVVNGKAWPNLNVEAKRYRFLMINGSNARFYELSLGNNVPMYVIGTDGGYLDNAVKVNKLVIGPGERYQLIIDFGKYGGKTLIMTNTGRTPFPKGAPPQGSTLGRIVQFTVAAPAAGYVDPSYNPATTPAIRSAGQLIQRLVTPPGTINTTVTVAQTRQLTLNEVIGAGGPLEILVNNTKWNGQQVTRSGQAPITGFSYDGIGNYLSELPAEGTTEVWEIINLTADAHPIHLHLVQFQILNRQNFNVNKYVALYNSFFPAAYDFTTGLDTAGGVFVPAFGPPANYFTGLAANGTQVTSFLGGNPDVTPFLQGKATPADPNEQGWKDTAIMYPGQVTRIAVRFAPTDTAPGTTAYYPFVPNPPNTNAVGGVVPNYNFVWHCHIVDHEDNEMMRPYQVDSSAVPSTFTRTYIQGTDY
jgi:spore coat protein A